MKRLTAALLAIGLASNGAAFAQSSYSPSGNGYNNGYNGQEQGGSYSDYARVIRVDPVLDGRYGATSGYNSNGQRCYENTTAGSVERDGYYGNGSYNNGSDPYRDPYGNPQAGSSTARNVATVVGGIAGAVLGSKVGGGTGSVAASAIGTMVGGMAGRQIYEQTQRNRNVRPGVVTVCDPEPVTRNGDGVYSRTGDNRATAYDVTYEYNGRRHTRRMDYHPGERVRVRVDVSPE